MISCFHPEQSRNRIGTGVRSDLTEQPAEWVRCLSSLHNIVYMSTSLDPFLFVDRRSQVIYTPVSQLLI